MGKMANDFDNEDTVIEPRVAVVGIGGAGCNVVNSVYWDFASADTIAINTDRAALEAISADKKLFICRNVTKGQGTGGDALLGRRCAQAHMDDISDALEGHDIVFIVAGMGGGTGTGAAPVVAEIAQRMNLITFSIAINPFSFESARGRAAKGGMNQLRAVCSMTVSVENDLILQNRPDMALKDAYRAVNRSIISFIKRQKARTVEAFIEQLRHLDSIIVDPGVPVSTRALDGNVMTD
jgi:cell division protein FtsZ